MSGGGRQTFRRVIQISGAVLILVSGIHGLTKGADFASVVSTAFGCLLVAGIIRYWNPANAITLQINSRTYLIHGLGWLGAGAVGLAEGLIVRGFALPMGVVACVLASYVGLRMLWASVRT
jgi:hypothetical protein